jgi:SAM-dependent methyltransferase
MVNNSAEARFIFDKKYQLFLNFIKHTDQATNATRYMEKIITDIAQKISNNSTFRYLDIGCGYGYKTLSIIDTIKKHRLVNTTAIDPSSELLSIFKKQAKNENIDYICTNWENYQPVEDFHLISSIHTFYYIANWQFAINKMMNCLNNKGTICIAIRSDDEICKFKNYFFKKIQSPSKTERNFNELCDLLEKMNIKYKSDIVESKLNIQDCLLENDAGKQVVEFLLRMPYEDIPNSIKDEIKKYLEMNHHDGCLTHQDGFVWIST